MTWTACAKLLNNGHDVEDGTDDGWTLIRRARHA
jgi:hypothetical protein